MESPGNDISLELERAVERNIITTAERELIEETRGGAVSLRIYAASRSESYDMLRKRRVSAEHRLRKFVGLELVK
jgi:hypothetical protein